VVLSLQSLQFSLLLLDQFLLALVLFKQHLEGGLQLLYELLMFHYFLLLFLKGFPEAACFFGSVDFSFLVYRAEIAP